MTDRLASPAGRRASPVALLVFLAALFTAGPRAWAEVRSIEEFVAESGKWREWSNEGRRVTVEGRITSSSRSALRMKNCDLPFIAPLGKDLPRLGANAATIEISGKMTLDANRPAFLVERVRELPSDFEEVQTRGRRARKNEPGDWYAIGRWARGRGEFYKDDELVKEAETAFLRGIALERAAIPAGEADPLFRLAAKTAELKLPESLRVELMHEGCRRKWDGVRKRKPPEFAKGADEFLEQLARGLPGSTIPLQPPLPRLEQKYLESPIAVYVEASAEDRRRLHRVFYSEVALARITRDAKLDGSDGMAVADRIEALLPEQHALAETWRERELQHRLKHVETASRQEMLDLSAEFRKRSRPDVARRTITTWLAKREDFLRKDGPDGLKQLAEEHLVLLEDEAAAAKFLIEAHGLSPESKEIAERLGKLGYHFKEGRWLTTREFKALPQDPIYVAMREGRVVPGMTREQVRKAVGPPTSMARVASVNEVTEIWTYGPKTASRLAIHLVRRGRKAGETKVTAVVQIPAQ